MTEETCKIKSQGCNKEALKRLTKYQDKEIEHKDPDNYHSQYFVEAIGDVFRELTHSGTCWYADNYIEEKLRKLDSFGKDNGGDDLERCNYVHEHKDRLRKEMNEWHPKLDEFKEKIKTEDIEPCRKEILLRIPELQQSLIKWGQYYYEGSYSLRKKMQQFIKDVKERI